MRPAAFESVSIPQTRREDEIEVGGTNAQHGVLSDDMEGEHSIQLMNRSDAANEMNSSFEILEQNQEVFENIRPIQSRVVRREEKQID